MLNGKYICIDFDGTCVEHKYPEIGLEVPDAIRTMHDLIEEGAYLLLWTCRDGKQLGEAVQWFAERRIPLIGINMNHRQKDWSQSPKAYAHLYIDDRNVGTPMRTTNSGALVVDWKRVRELLGMSP